MNCYLVDVYQRPIKANIFGRETEKLFKACTQILYDWKSPYEGCYRAFEEFLASAEYRASASAVNGHNYAQAYKDFLANHPEEKAKIKKSQEDWETRNKRCFRIVYGVAKKCGFFMRWQGKCDSPRGDCWKIYKNRVLVALLYCE